MKRSKGTLVLLVVLCMMLLPINGVQALGIACGMAEDSGYSSKFWNTLCIMHLMTEGLGWDWLDCYNNPAECG